MQRFKRHLFKKYGTYGYRIYATMPHEHRVPAQIPITANSHGKWVGRAWDNIYPETPRAAHVEELGMAAQMRWERVHGGGRVHITMHGCYIDAARLTRDYFKPLP